MFETDRIPDEWLPACHLMDEIWVPSAFNVWSFARAGVPRAKLVRIPEAIDVEQFRTPVRPLTIPGRRGFNFLSVFAWHLRKGWDVLLRAFLEEFGPDEDVALILKVWPFLDGPIERIRQEARFLVRRYGLGQEVPPRIVFYHADLPAEQLPRLYKAADAFVLPTRGEGWGRPLMEAMLMERPVIATRWGGQLEFLNDENAYLVDYRLVDVPERAYVEVELQDLDGSGYLDGRRVTTGPTRERARSPGGDFRCRAGQPGFAEAMVYHHLDGALRRLEAMGYEGARAIFRAPVGVDVRATDEDSSWYSPEKKQLSFGTGDVDDAEDADVIVHELGHALQDAVCPDFGASPQAAAMGEGFGDYLAASAFAEKKPRPLRAAVMLWDGLRYHGPGALPGVRRLDEPLTFESFDHAATADEHDNGQIWSATLWDARAALGRDVADRIIVESHFQLDSFATFARGARAILDADANLHEAIHREELVRIFHRRGIAPVE